jgi:hypothetical protein
MMAARALLQSHAPRSQLRRWSRSNNARHSLTFLPCRSTSSQLSLLSTTSSDDSDTNKADHGQPTTAAAQPAAAATDAGADIVYESPLGKLVKRLRTVSLATGVCGTLGLPLVVAIKGGDLPSTGLLAFGVAFLTGSLGSTAAIHFVFSPYVFTIERIPVRLCHYKKDKEAGLEEGAESTCAPDPSEETIQDQAVRESPSPSAPKDYLYKATSRSLFLTRIETVFNPETDVTEYKGFKPLCNFVAKGRPLYVHPEYVYNAQLRRAMKFKSDLMKGGTAPKENPDDFL